MAIKVATAFVEVVPKVRNMGGALQKAFAGVDAGSLLGRKIATGVNSSLGKYVKIGAALSGVAMLGKKIAGITGSVINMGNEWGRTTSMLKVAVGTSGKWQKALEATHKAANGIGVPIKDMVESASRLVQLAPKTIPDYKTSLKFSTLLRKNLIATGASGAETASVMRQVTQALGKGIVNGDELNSIMENSPMIAQMLAKHLNVDVGKLKALGKAGQISGDALRDAILENANKINKQFAMMPITADRAFTSIKNDWEMAANQTATKISQALGHGLTSISSSGAVTALANGLKGVIPLATSVGNAIANIFNKLAPVFAKVFSPDNVKAFLNPLTGLLDKIGKMDLSQLAKSLKIIGFVGALAFSGILKGADSFLGRIPIIGGALVKLKKGLVSIGGAAGKMAGGLLKVSGMGFSKLGEGLQTIARQMKRFDAGAQSIKLFVKAVSNVDFKKMGKDGAEFVDILKDMQRGNLNVRDSVLQLGNAMREAEANGKKIPPQFKNAFKLLENEANASCNTIKARFTDMVAGIQAIARQAKRIKLFDSKVTVDEANKVRASIVAAVKSITGIKIPDFLTQPIGSMVASASNALGRLGNVAQKVFRPVTFIASKTLTPMLGVFGKIGAGVKNSLGSAVDAARAKFPALDRAVSALQTRFTQMGVSGRSAFKTIGATALNAAGGGIKFFGSALKGLGSVFGAVSSAASAFGVNFAIISAVTAALTTMLQLNPSDFAASIAGMVKTVTTSLKNLAANIPLATKGLFAAIPQIKQAVEKYAPEIVNGIVQAFNQIVPALAKQLPAAAQGLKQFFESLVANIPPFASMVVNGFATLFQSVTQALPTFIEELAKTYLAVIEGAVSALPQALPKMISGVAGLFKGVADFLPKFAGILVKMYPQLMKNLSDGLMTSLPELVQGLLQFIKAYAAVFPTLMPVVMESVGQLVHDLAKALPPLMVQIIAVLPEVAEKICAGILTTLPYFTEIIAQLIGGLIESLPQLIGALVGALPELLQSVFDAICDLTKVGLDVDKTLFESFGIVLQSIWNACWDSVKSVAQSTWNWLTSTLNSVCQGLSSAWKACWNGVSSFFTNAWNSIKSFAQSAWNGIKSSLSSVLNSISSTWNSMWSSIKNFFNDIWNGIKSGAKSGVDAVFHFVTSIKGRILSFFAGAGQWLVNAGNAVIRGFLNGLQSSFAGVQGFVSSIGNWIKAHKGPISYDKKLLIPAGNAIMQGFSKGLGDSWQGVQKQVAGFTKQSGNWFTDPNVIRLKTTVIPPDGGWEGQQNQLARVAASYEVDASQHGLTKQDVYEAFGEVMSQGVTLKLNGRGGEVMAGVLAKPMNNELNRLAKLGR